MKLGDKKEETNEMILDKKIKSLTKDSDFKKKVKPLLRLLADVSSAVIVDNSLNEIKKKVGLSKSALKTELFEIKKQIIEEKLRTREVITKKYPKEIQDKADALLLNSNIFYEVDTNIGRGLVGEKNNRKCLLLQLNPKVKKPKASRITGESSVGKTELVKSVIDFLPDECKLVLLKLSKTALYYSKPDYINDEGSPVIDLSNKVLWILEETGGEEAYEILRPILSGDQEEAKVRITTKDEATGKNICVEMIIKGQPVFVTTSTNPSMLLETGTRVYTLSPDDSKRQTESIVRFKKSMARLPTLEDNTSKEIVKCAISKLEKVNVWIPFSNLIEVSCKDIRMRRDIDKIFGWIESWVSLHQFQRPDVIINGVKYKPAYISDYLEILKFSGEVLKGTTTGITKPVRKFYDLLYKNKESFRVKIEVKKYEQDIKQYISEEEDKGIIIDHKKIEGLFKDRYKPATIRAYCKALSDAGWLIWLGKKSRISEYTLPSDERSVSNCYKSVTNTLNVKEDKEKLQKDILEKCYEISGKDRKKYISMEELLEKIYFIEESSDFTNTSENDKEGSCNTQE